MTNQVSKFMKESNPGRAILVFIISFLVIFGILNFQTIFGQVASKFGPKTDEQAYNLELENNLKNKYGSSAYLFEKSLDSIGQATVAIDKSNQNYLAVAVNTSNYISIPKLNIKAPVIASASNEQEILKSLKSGVVLYPGSVLPGGEGTSVIIGHSSSNFPITKYSAIFAGLNKLTVGDLVYINYNGQNYTYIIKDKRIGSSKQLASSFTGSDLVLGSCWPVGTDRDRIIVIADLQ